MSNIIGTNVDTDQLPGLLHQSSESYALIFETT